MTAADIEIATRVGDFTHIPGAEVVVLKETNNGETYNSKKFGTVTGVIATIMEDTGEDIAVSISGQQITIHDSGLSDSKGCLIIFGKK